MSQSLPEGVRRVQDFLDTKGSGAEVRFLPESTATAQEAADALGVTVDRIGKSIVFGSEAGVVAVAVVCGDQRVDLHALAGRLGAARVKPLRAEEVKRQTGYAIGGVSPFGLPPGIELFVDARLRTFSHCYVAAGHPRAVVRVEPESLVGMTGARVEPIAAAQ